MNEDAHHSDGTGDMALDPWSALSAELDAWQSDNRIATLWWRDDDAVTPNPGLDRLIDIATSTRTPVALAVIPAKMTAALVPAVDACPHVFVVQHGYAHTNHAPRGRGLGAWELGLHRGKDAVLKDLAAGYDILHREFGDRLVATVVPPWNRIDPGLFADLPRLGFCGVSAFGPRHAATPAPGLRMNNAHCDPVNWKSGAKFVGDEKGIALLLEHLIARRTGIADPAEATGILTHHLDMDDPAWDFVERLLAALALHPGAELVGATDLFSA